MTRAVVDYCWRVGKVTKTLKKRSRRTGLVRACQYDVYLYNTYRMASSHIQDGKWSWLVCLSATMSWFAAMGIVFSFGIFFPVFMDYFQESRQKTGMNVFKLTF